MLEKGLLRDGVRCAHSLTNLRIIDIATTFYPRPREHLKCSAHLREKLKKRDIVGYQACWLFAYNNFEVKKCK